ncbi:MAG: hypothetical protein ACXABV_02285 [Candidatus Thorarchaeota archaeon]|jgi:hypothetical protein
MGRTARTFRDQIRIEESKWKGFRRVLSPQEREVLDYIFDSAREYADAGTMIVTPRVLEVAFVSMFLNMRSEIEGLRQMIAELEKEA